MAKKTRNEILLIALIFAALCLFAACENASHSHEYGDWEPVREASCTESGEEVRRCLGCDNYTRRILRATGHEYTETVIAVETCTESGKYKYECTKCEYSYTEVVQPLKHNYTHTQTDAIPATCTESGWSAGIKCTGCDEFVVSPIKIPALGHKIVHYDAREASCALAGYDAYDKCERCEYSTFSKLYPAFGHTVVIDAAVEPTEEQDGLTEGSHCSVCLKVLVEQKPIPIEYSLELDINPEYGMALIGGAYESAKFFAGTEVYVAVDVKEGYRFVGWFDGDTLLSRDRLYTFCMPRKKYIVTAKFESVRENEKIPVWSGFIDYFAGSGTENDPYLISNGEQLAYFSDFITHSIPSKTEGKYFKLTSSIDLGGREWSPIGSYDRGFCGYFDGCGYTVSNFKITNKYESESCGFFGHISGTVSNLCLTDFEIEVSDKTYVGALAGMTSSAAYITNCYVDGKITVKFMNSYYGFVGGVIGHASGRIQNCHSNVKIDVIESGKRTDNIGVGGFIGIAQTENLSQCSSRGSISLSTSSASNAFSPNPCIGGFVGNLFGKTVSNCSADVSLDIRNYTATDLRVGGFAGMLSTTVTQCYAAGDVNITANAYMIMCGGFAGSMEAPYSVKNNYALGSLYVSNTSDQSTRIYAGGFGGYFSGGANIPVGCFAFGDVDSKLMSMDSVLYVGSVFGYIGGDFKYCLSTGNVSAWSRFQSTISAQGIYGREAGDCRLTSDFYNTNYRAEDSTVWLNGGYQDPKYVNGIKFDKKEINYADPFAKKLGIDLDIWELGQGGQGDGFSIRFKNTVQKYYQVTVNESVGGKASFTDKLVMSDFVTSVTAKADSGYRFVGWFIGDTLLSEEKTLLLTVTYNITLTPKFEPIN